jgi:hypothetical protein
MISNDGPANLTPDERLRAVAAILADGLLRLRARAALPSDPGEHPASKNQPELGRNCLEVSEETVLSVHTG